MKILQNSIIVLVLFLCPFNTFAETEPYIEFICHKEENSIVVRYDRLWEESGKRYEHLISASQSIPPSAWRLRKLREIKQKKENGRWKAWIKNSKIITQECEIDNQKYLVLLGVINGNPGNLYGICGGWFSGWVKIMHGEELVFETKFEENCNAGELITEIKYYGIRGEEPEIKKSSFKDYYKQ